MLFPPISYLSNPSKKKEKKAPKITFKYQINYKFFVNIQNAQSLPNWPILWMKDTTLLLSRVGSYFVPIYQLILPDLFSNLSTLPFQSFTKVLNLLLILILIQCIDVLLCILSIEIYFFNKAFGLSYSIQPVITHTSVVQFNYTVTHSNGSSIAATTKCTLLGTLQSTFMH